MRGLAEATWKQFWLHTEMEVVGACITGKSFKSFTVEFQVVR